MVVTRTINRQFAHLNGAGLNGIGKNILNLRTGIDMAQKEIILDIVADDGTTYPATGLDLNLEDFGFKKVYVCEVISNDYDNYNTVTHVDTTDYDPAKVRARLLLASFTEESSTLGNGDATFTVRVRGF